MMKVLGSESERAYIYVHGMNGSKDDAEGFAGTAERFGYQVVSFDVESFDPVNTLPELEGVCSFAAERWKNVSLYAVSIGAWYSMVCFRTKPIAQTLLVSPVVSMSNLIERMMQSAGVSHELLREKGTIDSLSWEYYTFAKKHEITNWQCRTRILYPERDNITPRHEIEGFAKKFACELSVLPDAEHWIHTSRELEFLRQWEESALTQQLC